MSGADKEKGATEMLPVDLPCETSSYLVNRVEKGEGLGWLTTTIKTEVVTDFTGALFAILAGLLSMYAAAFRSVTEKSQPSPFLTLFAMGYPLGMMLLILTRANEMSLRKEGYYLLLKYRILMDWNNWGWGLDSKRTVWRHCFFFWFWLLTGIIMVAYAAINTSSFDECKQESTGNLVVITVLFVVVTQVWGVWRYFYQTLTLEQSGLITLNRFLENKLGQLRPEEAFQKYFMADGHDPVVILEERDIKYWAAARFSQLPWAMDWGRLKSRTETSEYKQELQEWAQDAEGDLLSLLRKKDAGWAGHDITWMVGWVYCRLWGFCLGEVLRRHPDFAVARPALRRLHKINTFKVLLSVAVCICMEIYAVYLIFQAVSF